MKNLKSILPYLLIILLSFYILPIFIIDTGSGMVMLLIIIPLVCFLCSLIYGIKHSFNLLLPVIVMVLFIPSIFIFYNYTAWVYSIIYGLVALVGNAVGSIFIKNKK